MHENAQKFIEHIFITCTLIDITQKTAKHYRLAENRPLCQNHQLFALKLLDKALILPHYFYRVAQKYNFVIFADNAER